MYLIEVTSKLNWSLLLCLRNEYKLGNRVLLLVMATGSTSAQNRHPPVQQYVTRKNEVALRGESKKLYCIFGGT